MTEQEEKLKKSFRDIKISVTSLTHLVFVVDGISQEIQFDEIALAENNGILCGYYQNEQGKIFIIPIYNLNTKRKPS